jgi:hypothetical protein
MMLSTDIWVGALIRRAELAGAFATVLRKGDPRAGSVLVKVLDRGAGAPSLCGGDEGRRRARVDAAVEDGG